MATPRTTWWHTWPWWWRRSSGRSRRRCRRRSTARWSRRRGRRSAPSGSMRPKRTWGGDKSLARHLRVDLPVVLSCPSVFEKDITSAYLNLQQPNLFSLWSTRVIERFLPLNWSEPHLATDGLLYGKVGQTSRSQLRNPNLDVYCIFLLFVCWAIYKWLIKQETGSTGVFDICAEYFESK